MKLTWFGATALRLHFGGEIVVIDAARARHVEPAEIVSGADRIVESDSAAIEVFDAGTFVSPRPRRAIDIEGQDFAPRLYRLEAGLLLASGDEPMVVVLGEHGAPPWGPWADGAVILVADEAALEGAIAAFAVARPRLVALALDQDAAMRAVERVRPVLGRAGLMVLEAGLALEI